MSDILIIRQDGLWNITILEDIGHSNVRNTNLEINIVLTSLHAFFLLCNTGY